MSYISSQTDYCEIVVFMLVCSTERKSNFQFFCEFGDINLWASTADDFYGFRKANEL